MEGLKAALPIVIMIVVLVGLVLLNKVQKKRSMLVCLRCGTQSQGKPHMRGSFSLTYSPTYNRPASLALLARTWTGAISSGGIATIAVSATGVISGTDTLGCVYAGAVSVIDPTKNIYNATVSVSICSPAATYTGFAILQDFAPGTNNQIDFMVGLSTRSVFGALR